MISSRPRRSRLALGFCAVLLALGAVEISGRTVGVPSVTPSGFLQAAWAVATGDRREASAPPPTSEQFAKLAFRPLPYLNYGLKPNWERERDRPDAPRRTSNSLGFRGREVKLPKPAGCYRIACLGGSTTYDDAVSDDEAYPVRMEEVLRAARPELGIEVVNCGVPSYTSAESLANLAFRVLDLEPDAVVLYEGINDLRPRPYRNFDGAYFHYRKVWNGGAGDWQVGDGDMAGGINALIQHPPPPENGNGRENSRRNGPGTFRRNLLSMVGIAQAHGVAVVMVSNTVDEGSPYITPDLLTGIREHNAVVREACELTGSVFVDLDAAYPKGADIPAGGLFHDPVHNNAQGSLVKGRIVAQALLRELFD